MNQDLLQNFYTGLETLMRERRQLVARRMLAIEPKTSVAAFPLTPALSIGERENRSPVARKSNALQDSSVHLTQLPLRSRAVPIELAKPENQASNTRKTGSRELLFPLPEGEGQGEGKAFENFKTSAA